MYVLYTIYMNKNVCYHKFYLNTNKYKQWADANSRKKNIFAYYK